MRKLSSTIFLLCLSCSVVSAKLSPLPSWSDEDKVKLKSGDIVVGRALLTKNGLKNKTEIEPKVAEVLIELVEEKPSLVEDLKLAADSVISGIHLERYFSERPETGLVDPQQLLSMQERADLRHALEQHGQESDVPIFVYLFDTEQKLSEEYSPREVYNSLFMENKEPIVMVYYFVGAPHRAKFLLAGGAGDAVPAWQVRELLWNAAHKAKEKSAAFDQLDDFVGQLSMRLFWVEEIIRELTDVVPDLKPKVAEKKTDARAEKVLGFWEDTAKGYMPKVLVTVFAVGMTLLIIWFLIRRRRYIFPDSASSSRLGGVVGGSFGGILSYRDQYIPPSDQKSRFEKDFF